MDASASSKVDSDLNQIYGFFLKIENSSFPALTKQNNTVIKYTKLPENEINSKVFWPQNSYTLQPRLRRIIGLDGDDLVTSRSLQNNITIPQKVMAAGITRRKIVTISEDDEHNLHPRFKKDSMRDNTVKTTNRSVEANFKEDKQLRQKANSRLSNITKTSKDPKSSAKINNLLVSKELNISKVSCRSKNSKVTHLEHNENKSLKEKDLSWNSKHSYIPSKTTESNNRHITTGVDCEKQINIVKYKPNEKNVKVNYFTKKLNDKNSISKLSIRQNKSKEIFSKDNHANNKSVIIIHVPLDEKYQKDKLINNTTSLKEHRDNIESVIDSATINKKDCGTSIAKIDNLRHVCIGTDTTLETSDKMTEVNQFELKTVRNFNQVTDVQTEILKETFDNLDIPNVTLTKDKTELNDEVAPIQNKLLPNLQIPSLKVTLDKEETQGDRLTSVCKNTSFIIRHATVTYTTKQEINFHVVDSNSDTGSNRCPSPLAYPLNVVSMFKKEIKNKDSKRITETGSSYKTEYINKNYSEELNSLNCSYVLNSNKLMKPSDIISSIRSNNGLMQSDSISEQFQRELNFIDSFFESLHYLESSSLSNKSPPNCNLDHFITNSNLLESDFDERNLEYVNLLSKLENGANINDTETMASRSLCLLNLLIKDEQRRAQNLLFVLKMREDALKDFTKAQILWLENKKRQDNNNTAISTLKKKQRGALLKLQHECGEMQRMRKALLTLSEKRKIALIKTKKNIEFKLKNNINVDPIILGKKKLKRSTDNNHDRSAAPLKCFDLSSSGCEEYTSSRRNSDACKQCPEVSVPLSLSPIKSAEKSIQTGDDCILGPVLCEFSNTAPENFVAVDGGYLNILFHNLSLPQIFSSGKQYEVNEAALRNIVNSTNSSHSDFNDNELVEKLMDQIKNHDLDVSSSPSTARSLVDEFDQYYKVLTEEEKSSVLSNLDYSKADVANDIRNTSINSPELNYDQYKIEEQLNDSNVNKDINHFVSDNKFDIDQLCEYDSSLNVNSQNTNDIELDHNVLPTGPLPVPAGEAAVTQPRSLNISAWPSPSITTSNSDVCSFSSQPLCSGVPSTLSLSSNVHSEAEELRRQQLAIEREIKALEQQQCRLLVVREIPDKPPPPYTPPSDSRVPKPPRMFNTDDTTNDKIQNVVTDPENTNIDSTDAFDVFLRDFCQESVERQKSEQSDKPWDACNLIPQKPSLDTDQLVKKASSQLFEVLNGVAPTVVSSVGARRSDHIDDILFSEWRRCEPEWTNLHTDEAIVKNQVFESIFQKILTETIDEYKRIVHSSAVTE